MVPSFTVLSGAAGLNTNEAEGYNTKNWVELP